jgi:hypothetical protein
VSFFTYTEKKGWATTMLPKQQRLYLKNPSSEKIGIPPIDINVVSTASVPLPVAY